MIRERLAQLLREAPGEAQAVELEGSWWRWEALARVAGDLRTVWDGAGVGPDGRIALVLENRPEFLAALAAILASGRCVVTLSPLQPADLAAPHPLAESQPGRPRRPGPRPPDQPERVVMGAVSGPSTARGGVVTSTQRQSPRRVPRGPVAGAHADQVR